ncbi:MAG: hypothetical protein JWQ79_2314 [Mucilaginibacter sp.]|jgi:hypothetical protein|nr:hypothetical protein [Mucilaginibacter sp.]
MRVKVIFALLFMLAGVMVKADGLEQKFEKSVFYSVMDSGNLEAINNEIDIVTASSSNEKEGYEGALLMRKAGLVSRPAEKLKLFKAGRIKLETALLNNKDNAEFHFLRFAIQEHAPKIVKYRTDLEADKQFILKTYKNLSPVVQHAIIDYTKNSKLLHAQDF